MTTEAWSRVPLTRCCICQTSFENFLRRSFAVQSCYTLSVLPYETWQPKTVIIKVKPYFHSPQQLQTFHQKHTFQLQWHSNLKEAVKLFRNTGREACGQHWLVCSVLASILSASSSWGVTGVELTSKPRCYYKGWQYTFKMEHTIFWALMNIGPSRGLIYVLQCSG